MIHVDASVGTVSVEPNAVLPDLNISIFAQVKVVERMIGGLDREAPARARDVFDGSRRQRERRNAHAVRRTLAQHLMPRQRGSKHNARHLLL